MKIKKKIIIWGVLFLSNFVKKLSLNNYVLNTKYWFEVHKS